MNKKVLLVLLVLLIPFTFGFTKTDLNTPQKVYRVYLKGQSLGLIKSKKELNEYIDKQNKIIKTKYHVKKVYAPTDLKITKEYTFNDNLDSIDEIYNKIKNISPFTIKGYVIKINGLEKILNDQGEKITDTQYIYVLDRKVFEKSMENTAKSFVTEEGYNNFANKTQKEIKGTGQLIEKIYIQNKVTIKRENIPIDKNIYTNSEELSKYLVFGTTKEQKNYKVKTGDTLENVAFKNKMSIEELMIANPEIIDENVLLYPGQILKVGIISPQVSIVEEDYVVKKEVNHYTTEVKKDKNKYTDYEKVKQKGVDGQNIVTQKVQKVNGETTNATTINTEVVKEPIKEIVIKGTRKRQSGESGSYTGEAYGNIVKTKGTWGWPATCSTVSSPFGYRWGTLHDGTDIYGCGYGSKIFAAQSGKVVQSEYMAYPNGHYITIEHDNGYYTLYAHLSARYVKTGDVVSKGQVIGAMGKTGAATGVHLHFGMWTGYPYRGGRPVNAMNYY